MQRECTKVYRHWRWGVKIAIALKYPQILFCTRCADPRWPRKHGELLPSFFFFFSFQFCPSFSISPPHVQFLWELVPLSSPSVLRAHRERTPWSFHKSQGQRQGWWESGKPSWGFRMEGPDNDHLDSSPEASRIPAIPETTNSTIWLWHGAPISTREQKPLLHLHLLAHTLPLLDPSRSKVFKGKEFTS